MTTISCPIEDATPMATFYYMVRFQESDYFKELGFNPAAFEQRIFSTLSVVNGKHWTLGHKPHHIGMGIVVLVAQSFNHDIKMYRLGQVLGYKKGSTALLYDARRFILKNLRKELSDETREALK